MIPIVLYAVPVFLISILAELLYGRWRGLSLFNREDSVACLAMGLGNVVMAAATRGVVLAVFFVLYEYRLFEIPTNAWWAWGLLLISEDFCYYWFHRFHHEVRFMWAAHVNHHSSQYLNFAVALRQSWTTPFTGPVFWMILPLLGFHPLMILTQQAISLVYQFFIHTETVRRLGPLEWIFNTPSHHRVHHGANPQYIDKNYGGILIIWDRLFGTFEPEDEQVKYGLTRNIETYNPIRIAFHEWQAMWRDLRAAPDWRSRARAVFGRPVPKYEG